ncbi:MAG: hypothetical protein RBS99_12470 [Rhodospirillales bacterium]|jgi:hypothetical protein|nr:hypothetical protein [Rhodospirillales bacterium]
MLSEGSFIVNHWITILWLVAAGLYTSYAVIADICRAKTHPKPTDQN